ncbi:MAG: radical SAM protein [bacterium]
MRLLLINPPVPSVDVRAPEAASTAGRMPPMGLLALATHVKSRGLAEVRLLDLQAADKPDAAVREAVKSFTPQVVGVSCCLFTFYDAVRAARAARETAPDTHICMGGHHASVYPAETAGLPEVDSAVSGEGERTFEELLVAIQAGRSPAGLAGVAARDGDGKVVVGPPRELIRDLDSLPAPDRSILGETGYAWILDRGERTALLFAGRGCPFKCSFCFNVMRSTRFHSPEYIVEDMKRCVSQGYTLLNFYDETFNFGRERTTALARAIGASRLGVPWTFRGRCDVMDDELARELAAAGCRRINFGIEAGTDETLRTYRKQTDVDTARRAVESASRAGIEPVGYFILGAPGETREQCEETIRFACSLPLNAAQFMVLIPLPGTEIYERALAEGALGGDYLRRWAADPREPLRPRLWETALDEPALLELMRAAYRRFYLRPGYIARQFPKLRSWRDFVTRARAAFSILRYVLAGKRPKLD